MGYPTADLHQSSDLAAAAAQGAPNQAVMGSGAKAFQPSSSSSAAVRLPPGLRLPQQAGAAAGVPQEAAGSVQQTIGQSAQVSDCVMLPVRMASDNSYFVSMRQPDHFMMHLEICTKRFVSRLVFHTHQHSQCAAI